MRILVKIGGAQLEETEPRAQLCKAIADGKQSRAASDRAEEGSGDDRPRRSRRAQYRAADEAGGGSDDREGARQQPETVRNAE